MTSQTLSIKPEAMYRKLRSCTVKTGFSSENAAWIAMRSEGYTSGKTPYNCKWCGLVHIGHPNKGNQQ